MEYWRRTLDDLESLVWWPYVDCEQWLDDDIEMPFLCQSIYLIGWTYFIIERFMLLRVLSMVGFRGCPREWPIIPNDDRML